MNKRIFISYKRDDKDVVFKIKDDIEKHVGEKCWIDLDGIESDAQFVNVIINAIDEAEIFLFMYSKKHAEITDFEIDWTIREINYAQTEGKRIIFLNIDRTPLSKWFKMMFGLKQQVDVHSNVAMNKLYADLTKWLEKRSEGSEISLKSDLDCRVYKDGLEWCSLRKGETKVVLLLKGTYKLNFVSNENSADYYEEDCVVEDNDIKKYLNISLLPIKEKREKEEKRKSGNVNGHEYVDLGLPSGLKWATCKVGAIKPEEYGDYFAWGEVKPKKYYGCWSTYKYYNGSGYSMTKYCNKNSYGNNGFTDNKTVLDPEDDAATVNWGGSWRMSTDAEMTELREKCTWNWTTQNGVKGYKVVGPNGNSIFLPAAGFMGGGTLGAAGSSGFYRSSSLYTYDPGCAYYVSFDSVSVDRGISGLNHGLSVRPVCQ